MDTLTALLSELKSGERDYTHTTHLALADHLTDTDHPLTPLLRFATSYHNQNELNQLFTEHPELEEAIKPFKKEGFIEDFSHHLSSTNDTGMSITLKDLNEGFNQQSWDIIMAILTARYGKLTIVVDPQDSSMNSFNANVMEGLESWKEAIELSLWPSNLPNFLEDRDYMEGTFEIGVTLSDSLEKEVQVQCGIYPWGESITTIGVLYPDPYPSNLHSRRVILADDASDHIYNAVDYANYQSSEAGQSYDGYSPWVFPAAAPKFNFDGIEIIEGQQQGTDIQPDL